MRHMVAWFVTLIVFAVLDLAWLTLYAGAVFRSRLGPLLRAEPDLVAAVAFYLVYAAGMVILVVSPAIAARSVSPALWRGAVLGLTAYATFDLTNLAIVAGWSWPVSMMDMAWGTLASALAAAAGYAAGRRVRPMDLR